jgi:ribosomal protein S4
MNRVFDRFWERRYTTKDPARRSRSQISEYLPQRRKARKVRRFKGENDLRTFIAFLRNLGAFAPWREKYPIPTVFCTT